MEWEGTARSNYVLVNDVEAFKRWAKELDLSVVSKEQPENSGVTRYAVISQRPEGWPTYREDEDGDAIDDPNFDLFGEFSFHLSPGEIAVCMEAGHEGERYVTGSAVAFTSEDNLPQIVLSDIYELAASRWSVPVDTISKAQY